MTAVLAIDPGTERSAWLLLEGGTPSLFGLVPNAELLDMLSAGAARQSAAVAIERVESYGMPVGREVFDTVLWAGRFCQAVAPAAVVWVPRREVKLELCGSPRANDATVRQALIDRFGGSSAVGRKASPGPLYGIHADVWSALAVAVTAEAMLGRDAS